MRRLIFVAVLAAAPMLTLDSTSASACGWFGNRGYAPRAYSYTHRARYAHSGARVSGWRDSGWRGWRW
jgi:hypothetical protein